MKTTLLMATFLVFIASSCKEKLDTKTETANPKTPGQIDTLAPLKPKVKKKVYVDYKTIQKPTITKVDYINFFNEILRDNGLVVNEKIKSLQLDPEYSKSELMKLTQKSDDNLMSELIDINDIKFIYEQVKTQKNVSLEAQDIARKTLEKKSLDIHSDIEEYWAEVYKLGSGYYHLTLPLFSLDKTLVIFKYSYSCGSLCANAGTYIFKKIDGKWKQVGIIGGELVS